MITNDEKKKILDNVKNLTAEELVDRFKEFGSVKLNDDENFDLHKFLDEEEKRLLGGTMQNNKNSLSEIAEFLATSENYKIATFILRLSKKDDFIATWVANDVIDKSIGNIIETEDQNNNNNITPALLKTEIYAQLKSLAYDSDEYAAIEETYNEMKNIK